MNLRHAYRRFKSFGGLGLLREYHRMGIVWALVQKAVWCIAHRRSLKNVYAVVSERVTPHLESKYQGLVPKEYREASEIVSKKVWFCWLQGLDSAPEMVKACYDSVCRFMDGYEVVVIDTNNYREYVELPGYVEEKWKERVIPSALFSDILRLELLIRYGGVWIDSTVLMTDPGLLMKHEWLDGILNADLFFFLYRDREKRFSGIGNWFISARPGHWALKAVRDVLYAYWRDYNCVMDYYIFHRVFGWIAKRFPEVVEGMPKRWAVPSLYLRDRLAMDYDVLFWQELTSHVCLHKLNYRKEGEAKRNVNSYWMRLLKTRKTL